LFAKLKAGILLAVTNQWCGVNGVLFYSNSMYDDQQTAKVFSLLNGLILILMTYISGKTVIILLYTIKLNFNLTK
jgi:hypothetical protein